MGSRTHWGDTVDRGHRENRGNRAEWAGTFKNVLKDEKQWADKFNKK